MDKYVDRQEPKVLLEDVCRVIDLCNWMGPFESGGASYLPACLSI